jgi:alanine racemase
MARLGVPLPDLEAFLAGFARFAGARIDGLMTQLASADRDPEFTAEQLRAFQRVMHLLRARGHRPKVVHAANSAGTILHPAARFDMVRPGIALFGGAAGPGLDAGLRPALRLRTEVIALRDLPVGATVGYERAFRAERPTRIATVPVGYGDGLMRAASGRGAMLVGGRRCPIAGNVSMDLAALDVTDVPAVSVGDEVVLLGEQGGERIDAAELARASGTIAYEVLTAISRRVPRFYTG